MELVPQLFASTGVQVGRRISKQSVMLERVRAKKVNKSCCLAEEIFPNDRHEIRQSIAASVVARREWSEEFRSSVHWVRHYVAKKDDRRVGFTGLTRYVDEEDAVWVDWLGVRPRDQGNGLAKEIVKVTISKAQKKTDCKTLRLWTTNNAVAEKLYAPAGFVRQCTPFEQDGAQIIICSRSLGHGKVDPVPPYEFKGGDAIHPFSFVRGVKRLHS